MPPICGGHTLHDMTLFNTHTPPKRRASWLSQLVLCLAAFGATSSFAGRPLAVDDANVNDVGSGHVETFYQRQPGGANTWTISPAFGLVEGIEIAAAFNRDNTADVNTTAVQLKWRITPAQKSGCNLATSLGLSQPNLAGAGASHFINGLMTCNVAEGSAIHLNLGINRAPGGPNTGVWGVAYEREFGAVTGHIEAFGQENALPTLQIGLRTMLTKSLQIDGTVGSTNGESVYSIGLKFLF